MLVGSGIFPSHILIGERSVQLGEVVRRAFKDSRLSATEWNALSEPERDCGILLAIYAMRSEDQVAPRLSTHVEPGRATHVPHEDLPTK